jgi:hypothetical protein
MFSYILLLILGVRFAQLVHDVTFTRVFIFALFHPFLKSGILVQFFQFVFCLLGLLLSVFLSRELIAESDLSLPFVSYFNVQVDDG